MRSFLFQPYPFSDNPLRKLWLCTGIGLFITLFLALFKPFGFDNLPPGIAWRHSFFFGGVTLVVSCFFQILLPLLFPGPFEENGWRSWKEIVYLLITTMAVGVGNFLLSIYLYNERLSLAGLLWSELTALQIGLFPVSFIVFMKQLRLYRRFATEAAAVNREIAADEKQIINIKDTKAASYPTDNQFFDKPVLPSVSLNESKVNSSTSAFIVLRGDNQNEELAVAESDLLFLTSADNYVNVRYRDGGQLKSALLRSPLKKLEEQLSGYPSFFRCHRMYIVNLAAVESVSGNAQGLKLHLSGTGEAISVSRSLTETVKERLQVLSHSPQTP